MGFDELLCAGRLSSLSELSVLGSSRTGFATLAATSATAGAECCCKGDMSACCQCTPRSPCSRAGAVAAKPPAGAFVRSAPSAALFGHAEELHVQSTSDVVGVSSHEVRALRPSMVPRPSTFLRRFRISLPPTDWLFEIEEESRASTKSLLDRRARVGGVGVAT